MQENKKYNNANNFDYYANTTAQRNMIIKQILLIKKIHDSFFCLIVLMSSILLSRICPFFHKDYRKTFIKSSPFDKLYIVNCFYSTHIRSFDIGQSRSVLHNTFCII